MAFTVTQDLSAFNLNNTASISLDNWTAINRQGQFMFVSGEVINTSTRNNALMRLTQTVDLVTTAVFDIDAPLGIDITDQPYNNKVFTIWRDLAGFVSKYSKIEFTPTHAGVISNYRSIPQIPIVETPENRWAARQYQIPSQELFIAASSTNELSFADIAKNEYNIRKAAVLKLIEDGAFRILQFRDVPGAE